MKNKIIKILEKPKVIIPIVFLISLIIGVLVYFFVGNAPKINIKNNEDSNNNFFVSGLAENFKDGEDVSLAFPKSGRIGNVYVKTGDLVHKGQVLAELASVDAKGAVAQASGALEVAKANYDKILNGATGVDIDILKSIVSKAESNLENTKQSQQSLVKNAYDNMLNSSIEAIPKDGTSDYVAPVISGNYNLGKEGVINMSSYYSAGGTSFNVTGLTNGSGVSNTVNAQPIGDSGLYIKFLSNTNINVKDWVINIPNKKASNYLTNYNAYQSALRGEEQVISLANSDLEQAQAILKAKQTMARPEDIAIAKAQVDSASGALQVAQGLYNNNFIYAPEDGIITVVNIKNGEISVMNQKAVGMIIKLNNKQ